MLGFEFSPENRYETQNILNFYEQYLKSKREMEGYEIKVLPTPRLYDYDAVVTVGGERKLNIEVKVRNRIHLSRYPQTKLPIRKHAVALFFENKYQIKSKYLCLFSNGLFSLNLHEDPDAFISMPNRWDRGGEICEYAMYGVHRFKALEGYHQAHER